MVRQTSIDAYNKIKASGLLNRRKWEVYDVVFHYGPITSSEVWQKIKELNPNIAQEGPQRRLCDLKHEGVITRTGEKRECSVTGMRVELWDVTGSLPIKINKNEEKVTKEQQIKVLTEDCSVLATELTTVLEERDNYKSKYEELISPKQPLRSIGSK